MIDPAQISAWLRDEAATYSDVRNVNWAIEAANQVDGMSKTISALHGHLLNAVIALESGGSKAEAIRIINSGIALARAGGAV